MEHPAVKVAAVVPVPDEFRGEEVKAYIVLKEGHTQEDTPPKWILDYAVRSWRISKCRDLSSMRKICHALHQSGWRSISYEDQSGIASRKL